MYHIYIATDHRYMNILFISYNSFKLKQLQVDRVWRRRVCLLTSESADTTGNKKLKKKLKHRMPINGFHAGCLKFRTRRRYWLAQSVSAFGNDV